MLPVRIVTYNLRMNTPHDGENSFDNRKKLIREKLLGTEPRPDIFCFQEALPDMLQWLKELLGEQYASVGFGRMADFGDEANPIFFRRDRFCLHGFEQIWLSPTPYEPGSRFPQQSLCPRICVCAVLKPSDGAPIRVFNTHLDNPPEAEAARIEGLKLIFHFIAEQNAKRGMPFVLTGDFNAVPDSETLRLVYDNRDLHLKDVTADIPVSYHAYGNEPPVKIDYILVPEKARVGEVSAWKDYDGVHYLSDHYPIEAEIISFSEE